MQRLDYSGLSVFKCRLHSLTIICRSHSFFGRGMPFNEGVRQVNKKLLLYGHRGTCTNSPFAIYTRDMAVDDHHDNDHASKEDQRMLNAKCDQLVATTTAVKSFASIVTVSVASASLCPTTTTTTLTTTQLERMWPKDDK